MLWLLPKLCDDLALPLGVIEEINYGPLDDPARKWIDSEGTRFLIDAGNVPTIISAWDLGKGESQVLAWAYLNKDYVAVLDDRAARNCASALGIKVIGTLGLIVLAHRNQLIPNVVPVFEKIVSTGFRVDGALIRRITDSLARLGSG